MTDSKLRLDANGRVILDPEPDAAPAHLDARAVTACGRCDDDGYRGGTVCDHQDHTEAAKRGMAAINEILGRKR